MQRECQKLKITRNTETGKITDRLKYINRDNGLKENIVSEHQASLVYIASTKDFWKLLLFTRRFLCRELWISQVSD